MQNGDALIRETIVAVQVCLQPVHVDVHCRSSPVSQICCRILVMSAGDLSSNLRRAQYDRALN